MKRNTCFHCHVFVFSTGEIGDWKNHFTVAMNEQFDAVFKEEMKDSDIQVQFEWIDWKNVWSFRQHKYDAKESMKFIPKHCTIL